MLGEPEAFFTTPGYDGSPLVALRLAQVNLARLKELVTDAWRMRAPDALVGDLAAADQLSDGDHGYTGTTSRQPTSAQTPSYVRLKREDQRRSSRADRGLFVVKRRGEIVVVGVRAGSGGSAG